MHSAIARLSVLCAVMGLFANAARAGGGRPAVLRALTAAYSGRGGCLVVSECASGAISGADRPQAGQRLPPCSTFKIWNTLIGLETGLLAAAADPFWKWDGITREYPAWNRNLTLGEAFRVSCVPAYQRLARRIGMPRMRHWIDRIGYGDRNLSAGIDAFWLPRPGRRTLRISPLEQVRLLCDLALGRVPFAERNLTTLRGIMTTVKTAKGTVYGKTGSGILQDGGGPGLGWFVGYLETATSRIAFAGIVQGAGLGGADARRAVEEAFRTCKLL